MKSYCKELWFNLPTRRGFVNITPQVGTCLKESGIHEGLTLVSAMHITASAFINDDESGLHHDYEKWLEKLALHEPVSQYRHNDTGEDNADAHMKRQVMGREIVVAVTDGQLDFGTWEQIFYGEFNGRQRKRVLVNYSLAIKPGQKVYLQSTPIAHEFNLAFYEEAIKAGAHVTFAIDGAYYPGAQEIFLKYASQKQLEFVSPVRKLMIETYDAR